MEQLIVNEEKKRICPVERADHLDNKIRRWFQSPEKILKPYLKEGMTILDLGCGPGFFSIDMAYMIGRTGRLIAADLQNGMLQKLEKKIKGTPVEKRITLHQCEPNRIGLLERVDFILAFYLIHELPDQDSFFGEIKTILKPNGQIFIAEPPLHVSKSAFEESIRKACNKGFTLAAKPKVFLSKTAILRI
jgi:ubiquinone/menaquinone biosynthesis C-methylase UbiE